MVIAGLSHGSLYAMIAVAVVLIFKATDIVNFAQAEMAMVCGFFAYSLLTSFHMSQPLTFLLVILFGGLVGFAIDRAIFRPLAKAPVLGFVVGTLGLNIALGSAATLIWGPEPRALPPAFSREPIHFGGMAISREHIAIIGTTLALVIVIALFFKFSKMGIAMRAVAQSRTVSTLLGINVERSFTLTWVISSAIGGLAGLLFANVVQLDIGYMAAVLIKGFTGAVLGGLLSIPGAMVGGLLLGVMETLAGGYVSMEFKEFIPLLVVLVVLLIKPEGIFSGRSGKRV